MAHPARASEGAEGVPEPERFGTGTHGFESPTGFDHDASAFEVAFEGLALAA